MEWEYNLERCCATPGTNFWGTIYMVSWCPFRIHTCMLCYGNSTCMMSQWTNISLNKKDKFRCYAKSATAQDVFQPTPAVISCAGVNGRGRLLSQEQNPVRGLASSLQQVEPQYLNIVFLCAVVLWKLLLRDNNHMLSNDQWTTSHDKKHD